MSRNRIFIFILLFFFFVCGRMGVDASYEPPLDRVLVYVDSEGGLRAPIYDMARVPLFLLYKNGDLLYSFFDEGEGIKKLMKAHLQKNDVSHLIKVIKEKGFAEWNEYYENCPLTGVPTTKLYLDIEGERKTVNVWGIDYAIKNNTIPRGLIEVYRKLTYFSVPDAKEFEPEKIILYVKKMPSEPKGIGIKICKWGQKIDLAPLSEETTLLGYGSVLLEGKNAKSVYKELKYKVPFSIQDVSVFFRQGRNFYSLGYRPLLLHEVEEKEKDGKK